VSRVVAEGPADTSGEEPAKSAAVEARSGFAARVGAAGMPVERSKDFKTATRRLAQRLRPDRFGLTGVVMLAVGSVSLFVTGPRILGHATNVIIAGIRGRVHGVGVDYGELHRLLFLAAGCYVTAAVLSYAQSYLLAGIVQRTMYQLRADVEAKLNLFPLRYIDGQPRGDLLSRVTNDIDNLAQSLQQTLSQLLTSTLTIAGVVIMMFLISPLLALVALVTIPLSVLTIKYIAKRSRGRFVAQWTHTGMLNAQVEETFTGHTIVKVFGRQEDVERRFNEKAISTLSLSR